MLGVGFSQGALGLLGVPRFSACVLPRTLLGREFLLYCFMDLVDLVARAAALTGSLGEQRWTDVLRNC